MQTNTMHTNTEKCQNMGSVQLLQLSGSVQLSAIDFFVILKTNNERAFWGQWTNTEDPGVSKWFGGYHNVSRSHRLKKNDRPETQRFQADPQLFEFIKYFQKYVWFTWIYLGVNISRNYSRFTEIPPSYFSVFIYNDWDWRLFWTHH